MELTAKAGDVATFPSGNRPGTRAGGQRAEMLVREIVTTDGQGRPAA